MQRTCWKAKTAFSLLGWPLAADMVSPTTRTSTPSPSSSEKGNDCEVSGEASVLSFLLFMFDTIYCINIVALTVQAPVF